MLLQSKWDIGFFGVKKDPTLQLMQGFSLCYSKVKEKHCLKNETCNFFRVQPRPTTSNHLIFYYSSPNFFTIRRSNSNASLLGANLTHSLNERLVLNVTRLHEYSTDLHVRDWCVFPGGNVNLYKNPTLTVHCHNKTERHPNTTVLKRCSSIPSGNIFIP